MNSDAWMCLLEFVKNLKSDLSNLKTTDNFWPVVLDDFIEWIDKDKVPTKEE